MLKTLFCFSIFVSHQQYFLLVFGLDFPEKKFKKREKALGDLETTVTEYLQNHTILEKKGTIGIVHFISPILQMGKLKGKPTERSLPCDPGSEGVGPRIPPVNHKVLTHLPGMVR